jgi:hypothetical protein
MLLSNNKRQSKYNSHIFVKKKKNRAWEAFPLLPRSDAARDVLARIDTSGPGSMNERAIFSLIGGGILFSFGREGLEGAGFPPLKSHIWALAPTMEYAYVSTCSRNPSASTIPTISL